MTPFRIRERLRKLLGGDLAPATDAVSPAAHPVPRPPAPVEPAPAPGEPPPVLAESPAAPVEPPAGESAPAADAPDAAKQARHWARTRKGMLKWLVDQGGTATMKDMHDKAESKYFVAHRSFSRLMEEFTEEGLVSYSGTTGIVQVTDQGRAAL